MGIVLAVSSNLRILTRPLWAQLAQPPKVAGFKGCWVQRLLGSKVAGFKGCPAWLDGWDVGFQNPEDS